MELYETTGKGPVDTAGTEIGSVVFSAEKVPSPLPSAVVTTY